MRALGKILKFEVRLWLAFVAIVSVAALSNSLWASLSAKTFTMPNQSMAPTIEKGAKVRVDMKAYDTENPLAGDLALFAPNDNHRLKWIFRVAAVPGDELSYRQGLLYVNGFLVQAPSPLQDQTFESPKQMKAGAEIAFPYRLGEKEYFFLSDDPNHMHDSRYWGTVERSRILGRLTSHK